MAEIRIKRLNGGRPILEARPKNAWESKVVLNPAADLVRFGDGTWDGSLDDSSDGSSGVSSALVEQWDPTPNQRERLREEGAACVILYRAQGAPADGHDVAPSSIGLAVFAPGFELVKRWDRPVICPDADYQNLGVEDPRITRVGDTWHMYYTGYSGDPARGMGHGRDVKICHATTTNFVDWVESGPIVGDLNGRPNKNAVLLPGTVGGVGGRWVLLHRPMEGPDAMAIHYAASSEPEGPWEDRGVLMRGLERPDCSRSWIGAGGPPVSLGDDRFLMVYHRGAFDHAGRRVYDLGAALLDFTSEPPGESDALEGSTEVVLARIEPVMRPTGRLEQKGDPEVGVDNVLFTCANYEQGGRLVILYAGADSRIFAASIGLSELVEVLELDP